MANITGWDPFREMHRTMQLFDNSFARPWRFIPTVTQYESVFPVEVSETDEAINVKASLPGVKPEEVDITIVDDVLTIKAQHKEETEERKRDFYRREIRYGSFHRSLSLPVSVDADKAHARFENGMLHLTLPKAEAVRPKQIRVGSASENGTG